MLDVPSLLSFPFPPLRILAPTPGLGLQMFLASAIGIRFGISTTAQRQSSVLRGIVLSRESRSRSWDRDRDRDCVRGWRGGGHIGSERGLCCSYSYK